MRARTRNDEVVLAVLAGRFRLPLERLVPGELVVVEAPDPRLPIRAFSRDGGALVCVVPDHAAEARAVLRQPAGLHAALTRIAAPLGWQVFAGVARTGTAIPAPEDPVTILDAADPRLPDWVLGHFTGRAWCVLEAGRVLSTAVLKRYDPRIREIAVGTDAAARGRGLARSVTAAAARAVLEEGRAVLYNHAVDNLPSARVAEAVGLQEFGRFFTVAPASRPDPGPEGPL